MNENETIADIRKEAEARFRELLEKHVDSLGHIQAMQQFNQVFDRIEAARSCEVQSLQGTIVKLNDAIAEKQELNENSKSAQIEFCNAAKLRKAAEAALKTIRGVINGTISPRSNTVFDCRDKLSAALAEPSRNCDVGTPEEQEKRFSKFCGSNADPTDIDGWACDMRCPLYENHPKCKEAWEQMPYKKGGEA